MSWWSSFYNRPLKDPILSSYTQEELAYEYFTTIERKKAEEERIQAQKDKEEEIKLQKEEDWADEMERMEMEKTEQHKLSEEDKKWMEKQIEESKKELGESFGEDVSLTF